MKAKTVSINLELSGRVDADMVRADYGVPGSPVWHEPRNMQVDDVVYIEGVGVNLDALPDSLADLIRDKLKEWADDCEGWD